MRGRSIRRWHQSAVYLILLAMVVLLAGCGGEAKESTPAAASGTPQAAAAESKPESEKLVAVAPDALLLNTIQLVVTKSTSQHLPNGVYVSNFAPNQSRGQGIVFMASGMGLATSSSLQVTHGDLPLDKAGATRTSVVGSLLVRYGQPPSGSNQLMNVDPIVVTYSYDGATNTYRGSFTGNFADGLTVGTVNAKQAATIEALFYVANPK